MISGLTLFSRLADGVGRFSSLCEMGNKKAVDQKSTACNASYSIRLVPRRGLEPPRLSALVPETSASTNSAIWASQEALNYRAFSSALRARLEEKCKSFAITDIGGNKKADGLRASADQGWRLFKMVPRRGLEPPRCYSLVPETSASTNSAIWASQESKDCILKK